MADFGLARRIGDLWKDGRGLTDLTIDVGNKTFKAHKLVLVSLSGVFNEMLEGGFKDNICSVRLLQPEANTFGRLLELIYSGNEAVVEGHEYDLITCARQLEIDSVEELCADRLISKASKDDYLKLYTYFKKWSLEEKAEQVISLFKNDYSYIIEHVHDFSIDVFQKVISCWEMSENVLYKNIRNWYSAYPEESAPFLDELMSKVQFQLMIKSELKLLVESDFYKDENGRWKERVEEALKFVQQPIQLRILDTSHENQIIRGKEYVIYFETFQGRSWRLEHDQKWCRYTIKPNEFMPCMDRYDEQNQTVVVNNYLIVSKGKRFSVYDPRMQCWYRLTEMEQKRTGSAIVHHDGYLYVIGGTLKDGNVPAADIKCYSLHTNTWITYDVPFTCKRPVACMLDNRLYISNVVHHPLHMYSTDLVDGKPGEWEIKQEMDECFGLEHPQKMAVVEILGEKALFMVDRGCEMLYYLPAKDKWSYFEPHISEKFEYDPYPYICGPVVISDNTIYVLNILHRGLEDDYDFEDDEDQEYVRPHFSIKYDISKTEIEMDVSQVGEFPIQERYPNDNGPCLYAAKLTVPYHPFERYGDYPQDELEIDAAADTDTEDDEDDVANH